VLLTNLQFDNNRARVRGVSYFFVDLASADTGSTAGTATFNGVGIGTYYVRVRGKNACGLNAASNEVLVVVR
jgi:hypothetical protein